MEQAVYFVISTTTTILTGLIVNYIYDKLKNHSSTGNRKSGLELDIKINIKFNKK